MFKNIYTNTKINCNVTFDVKYGHKKHTEWTMDTAPWNRMCASWRTSIVGLLKQVQINLLIFSLIDS